MTSQADLRVPTPEHVAVSYPIAGIGNRFLAAFVDALLQGLIVAAVSLALLLQELTPIGDEAAQALLAALYVLVLFLAIWGYPVVFETVWNGQTPGKRAVGIRVLREDGSPVGFLAVLVRNLLRVVDFLPVGFALGVLSILITRKGQRLGDIAAGTIVVKARARRDFSALRTPAADGSPVLGVRGLSGEAQRLVREFVLREATLDPEARAAVARTIAEGIRPLVEDADRYPDDVALIRAVAAGLRAQAEERPR